MNLCFFKVAIWSRWTDCLDFFIGICSITLFVEYLIACSRRSHHYRIQEVSWFNFLSIVESGLKKIGGGVPRFLGAFLPGCFILPVLTFLIECDHSELGTSKKLISCIGIRFISESIISLLCRCWYSFWFTGAVVEKFPCIFLG